MKETSPDKSDLEFDFSGQPDLLSTPKSELDSKMTEKPERLELKCTLLELAEWFTGWRMREWAAEKCVTVTNLTTHQESATKTLNARERKMQTLNKVTTPPTKNTPIHK